MSARRPGPKALAREVARWNAKHAKPTRVRYWTGTREGEPREGVTFSEAQVLGGHTAGVYITRAGFVALSHVEAIEDGGEL